MSAAYTPRHYVIADTDRMSEEKICTFESLKQSDSQVHMMNFWFSLSVTDDSSVVMHSHSSLSSVGLCGPAAAPKHSAEVQIQ